MDKINCRVCNGALYPVLDLGELYVSDFLLDTEDGIKAPLVLSECKECGLTQLQNSVNLDLLYKEHYWYRSALNKSMLNDLEDIVKDIESRVELDNKDTVVDIGCNDGSLFDFYSNENIYKIGFDPAPNITESVMKKCNYFINDYYKYLTGYAPAGIPFAKVITSIAMFYDLPDPNKFVKDICKNLSADGIWVIQFTDLFSMLVVNAIDNICLEHLEYYRFEDIINLVRKHGLEVFDVSYNNVNGGSIRIFVGFKGKHLVSENVGKTFARERSYLKGDSLQSLYLRTCINKKIIYRYIDKFKNIYGLAASTKGNTLLQLLELDSTKIKAIGEINKDKFGLRTAGTNIPIIPESSVLTAKPDLIIVLAWHFRDTFNKVLSNYIEDGGTVLYPLPVPYIVTKEGVLKLDEPRD